MKIAKRKKITTSPRITKFEGLALFNNADLLGLGMMADTMRKKLHRSGTVSFIIDRNINYTNVCINRCKFCAFYRDEKDPEAYLLSKRNLFNKIEETVACGGTQILIQGGLHPKLDISYYVDLFKAIKNTFSIHVHGLSPPEIYYIAKKAGFTVKKTLVALKQAGLDSIPGGGAEILSDRIRKKISPKKIRSSQWLHVMEEAHRIGMKTTATMMFGSVETPEDIIKHLDAIRKLQDKTGGFTAFIPWSFQPLNTELGKKSGEAGKRGSDKAGRKNTTALPDLPAPGLHPATGIEYLRVLALSRIYLDNVPNIQASWVTQGLKMAQVALRFGANDFGSTMLEENVVAAAGVTYQVGIADIIHAIKSTGLQPVQRNMYYDSIRCDF